MPRVAQAVVLERQAQAIALHARGCSFDEIAEQVGYANRGSAWKAVDRGLRTERDLMAGEYLRVQVDRYEAILASSWDRATAGRDLRAAQTVLRVLERLDHLLRLADADHTARPETIVVSADPEQYVADLQRAVNLGHPAPGATGW